MKYILFALLLSANSLNVKAQNINNYYHLRDYKKSLVLLVGDNSNSQLHYGDYGTIVNNRNNASTANLYSYQSQEFDPELNIYLFHSRILDNVTKRFHQVDPAEQYFSPYSFLGGDPVNYIDYDGNEGKPLYLFGLESRDDSPSLVPRRSADLLEEVDAYQMPMADFINGKGAFPLKEWNGNVFVQSHANVKGELIAEKYRKGEALRSKPWSISRKKFVRGEITAYANQEEMSKNLARLAQYNKVDLKNIYFTGCQGEKAAGRIGEMVSQESKKLGMMNRIRTIGVKKGYISMFRFSRIPGERFRQRVWYTIRNKNSDPKKIRTHVNRRGEFTREVNEFNEESPVANTQEIAGMMNGRVPVGFQPYLSIREY